MAGEVPIQSAKATLDVVEVLASNGWMSLAEVVEELDRPRSTVHDYLSSLEREGYVVKRRSEYRVSTRFLDVGIRGRERMQIHGLAKPEVDDLAAETDEHASLMIEEHGKGVLLYIRQGERALDLGVSTGWRMALPTSAPGKAILAHLPGERVDAVLDEHGLPEVTSATITDRGELFDQLDRVRDRGFAVDHGERVEGVRAIAAPIVTGGRVHGAVTVSGPTNRMTGERFREQLPNLVRRATNVIEVQYTLDADRS